MRSARQNLPPTNETPLSERSLLLLLAAVQFTHIKDFMIMMPLGPQFMRDLQIGPGQTHSDWEKEIHRLTGKRGVDHVLEVGGPGTLGKSLACVAAGGHIAQIGVLTGFDAPQTTLFPLVGKNATMSGIYVGSRESFEQFVRFLDATKIKPVIDRTFDFADAPAAYEYMKSGAHFGKVVIAIQ